MSGPAINDRLYKEHGTHDWDRAKVNDLRKLADRVENGYIIGDNDDIPHNQIANLLRAKADKIEAALRTIDNETHDDYTQLVKAIQYNFTGDYGADKIVEAWDNYGEK